MLNRKAAVLATLETETPVFNHEDNSRVPPPNAAWGPGGTWTWFVILHSYWSGPSPKATQAHSRSEWPGSFLQADGLLLAVFLDSSPKGNQICCSSGHNVRHLKHRGVMSASSVSKLLPCHCSLKLCVNFLILIGVTACGVVMACCMVFLERHGGLPGIGGGMKSFYFHALGLVFCP